MASNVEATIEPLEERPRQVSPASIEDEFTRMLRESAGSSGYDASSIRLRVLNFLAFTTAQDAGARFESVLQVLPQRYPCRAILARTDKDRERLEATVSARCWHASGEVRDMCSEEVQLVASATQPQELASAVLALLVPELPVTAWVMDGPELRGRLSQELIEAADRIVTDTAVVPDIATGFRALLRDMRDVDARIADFAWLRLEAWRAMVAQFFDGDAGMAELARINEIEIESERDALGSEALLLAGWLVSRLGLSLADLSADARHVDATLYDGTRGVTLKIVPPRADGSEPARRIHIRTTGCVMTVEMHPASGHMHVQEAWGEQTTRRTVAVLRDDEASLVVMAQDDASDPAIYVDAVRSALALMGA